MQVSRIIRRSSGWAHGTLGQCEECNSRPAGLYGLCQGCSCALCDRCMGRCVYCGMASCVNCGWQEEALEEDIYVCLWCGRWEGEVSRRFGQNFWQVTARG